MKDKMKEAKEGNCKRKQESRERNSERTILNGLLRKEKRLKKVWHRELAKIRRAIDNIESFEALMDGEELENTIFPRGRICMESYLERERVKRSEYR